MSSLWVIDIWNINYDEWRIGSIFCGILDVPYLCVKLLLHLSPIRALLWDFLNKLKYTHFNIFYRFTFFLYFSYATCRTCCYKFIITFLILLTPILVNYNQRFLGIIRRCLSYYLLFPGRIIMLTKQLFLRHKEPPRFDSDVKNLLIPVTDLWTLKK
jgi:hypothetical protein